MVFKSLEQLITSLCLIYVTIVLVTKYQQYHITSMHRDRSGPTFSRMDWDPTSSSGSQRGKKREGVKYSRGTQVIGGIFQMGYEMGQYC